MTILEHVSCFHVLANSMENKKRDGKHSDQPVDRQTNGESASFTAHRLGKILDTFQYGLRHAWDMCRTAVQERKDMGG